MRERLDGSWVEGQVARTSAAWEACAGGSVHGGPRYGVEEQVRREREYDAALGVVESEVKRLPGAGRERSAAQERMTLAFARFAGAALDLEEDAVHLLTGDFVPAGIQLARWARRFDEGLSMAEIVQASRNAWTACGLQSLLGERVGLTPSILGYSLLYPYTDNFLDCVELDAEEKRRMGERFGRRLEGEGVAAQNRREAVLWALVGVIEGQYGRAEYDQVYECLLAIHRAQEGSVAQMVRRPGAAEVLRISCAKGGSSVLADGCLVRGWLTEVESEFCFDWGVLLQLGDDLQDVREDLQRGSATLFYKRGCCGCAAGWADAAAAWL